MHSFPSILRRMRALTHDGYAMVQIAAPPMAGDFMVWLNNRFADDRIVITDNTAERFKTICISDWTIALNEFGAPVLAVRWWGEHEVDVTSQIEVITVTGDDYTGGTYTIETVYQFTNLGKQIRVTASPVPCAGPYSRGCTARLDPEMSCSACKGKGEIVIETCDPGDFDNYFEALADLVPDTCPDVPTYRQIRGDA